MSTWSSTLNAQSLPNEFDVGIRDFTGPAPLVLDVDNRLVARISNEGATPVQVRVELRATSTDGTNSLVNDFLTGNIQGQQTVDVAMIWNGRTANDAAGAPILGSVTLRLDIRPVTPSGINDPDMMDNSRSLARHVGFTQPFAAQEPVAEGDGLEPGGAWTGRVLVENRGNVDDAVQLELLPDASPGWTFELDRLQVALPLDAPEAFVEIRARAPANAFEDEEGTVTVRASSATAPSNQMDAVFRTAPVLRTGTLFGEFDPPQATINPGELGSTAVDVTNVQNAADTVRLTLQPQGAAAALGANVAPQTAQSISSGQTFRFNIGVATTPQTVAGTYVWHATISSTRADGPTVAATGNFALKVRQVHALRLEPTSLPASVEPGRAGFLAFRLHNDGNGMDDVRLRPVATPSDWTIGSLDQSIPPHSARDVQLPFQLASGAQPGPAAPQFELASLIRPQTTASITWNAEVLERPFPILASAQERKPVNANSHVDFSITASNLGNVADRFTLVPRILADQTSPDGWDVQAAPGSIELQPGQSVHAQVRVHSPDELLLEDGIVVDIEMRADTYSSRTHVLQLEVFRAAPDLRVDIVEVEPDPLYRDHPASLLLSVTNEGTFETTQAVSMRVEFRSQPSTQLLASHEVAIPPLNWATNENVHNVTVTLPTTAERVSAHVALDPDEAILDRDRSDNLIDRHDFATRTFGISISVPSERAAGRDQLVRFADEHVFRVTNAGSHTETLTAEFSFQPEWAPPLRVQATVVPGDAHDLNLELRIPSEPQAEAVQIRLRVHVSHAETPAVSDTLRLRVPDTEPPVVNYFEPSANATTANAPLSFRAQISDPMGVQQVKLFLVAPNGLVESYAMTKDADGTYGSNKTLPFAGRWKSYVWAQDSAVARNVADTSEQPQPIDVHPPGKPLLQVVEPPEGAIVLPGAPIVLNVRSGFPLQSLTYTAHGQTNPVPNTEPRQISTASWPDGIANVRIVVRDIYGSTHSLEHNISVDATPPTISNIRLEPENPGPAVDTEIFAMVEDAHAIRSVIVRLEAADHTGREIPMEAAGSEYKLIVRDAGDASSITIIAEDEVGNRGYAERNLHALRGVEPPAADGKSAGPELGLVLLAFFVVALVRASRRSSP